MLQLDWSIWRLRPNSVSSGCTETQFDACRAVAAAFADRVVDEHALGGIGIDAALAAAALLGGAGLVVDQDGEAGDLAQLALHGVELVAVVDGHAVRRSRRSAGYLSGSSMTTTMRLAPSAATCCAICATVSAPVGRLAAGHRDRVVVEDLVGDVDAGGRGGADRQQAGMGVGAVAEVLEDVLLAGERRLADPGRRPRRPCA